MILKLDEVDQYKCMLRANPLPEPKWLDQLDHQKKKLSVSHFLYQSTDNLGPLLLAWFNVNPSMDK